MVLVVDLEEVKKTPVFQPVSQQTPVSQPVPQQTPVSKPVPQQTPVSQPVPQQTPVSQPVPQQTPVSQPVSQPVPQRTPVSQPVPQQTTVSQQMPVSQPASKQTTVSQPVSQQATESQPVFQQAAVSQRLSQQTPMSEPVSKLTPVSERLSQKMPTETTALDNMNTHELKENVKDLKFSKDSSQNSLSMEHEEIPGCRNGSFEHKVTDKGMAECVGEGISLSKGKVLSEEGDKINEHFIKTGEERDLYIKQDVKSLSHSNKKSSSSFGGYMPTLQGWVKSIREQLEIKDQAETMQALFSNCKTDEDRVSLLYNLPIIHEVLDVKELYKGKDQKEGKDLRLQGNLAFQNKNFDVAVRKYSESILTSPSGNDLALAFGNRSAVLYQLKQYVLCIQDIKQAFKNDYPEHLQYKLFERRGKAFYFLRLKEDAIFSFQDALNVIGNSDLAENKMETLREELTKQLQKCEKLSPAKSVKNVKDFNHSHGTVPVMSDPLNHQIPCMANSLNFKYSERVGRGLYAARDIEVGEILIIEKPYASVTLPDYNLSHCHHCCNRVLYPLPCQQCSGVVFCSEECQQTAWKTYHYAECKYHDLIQISGLGMGQLALRMVLKAGHQYLHELKDSLKETFNESQLLCDKQGCYDSENYQSVYSLVSHTEDRSPIDLFKRTVSAVFLLKCIEKSDFFLKSDVTLDSHKERFYIGGHILRHLQMLPCNAHEVSEFVYKRYSVPMSEPEEVGSAIYATLSLINHSCDPAVVRHSYGNVCVVRAIRNVSKGEEILDNYGVLYPVMSKPMRQEKLMSQYFFSCSCNACMCNWPMYDKIPSEFPVLKCKKCKIGRVMIPADNQTTRAICADCREVADISRDLLHLSKSEQFYQGSLDKVLKGEDPTGAEHQSLEFLQQHLRLIDRLLLRPWRDYNDCQEAIKQCYSTRANCTTLQHPDTDDEELMEAEASQTPTHRR